MFTITVEQDQLEKVVVEPVWAKGAEPTKDNPDGFGYTPQEIHEKGIKRMVYKQTVKELDLKAVIMAVNPKDTA